jgi:hypothetical protein
MHFEFIFIQGNYVRYEQKVIFLACGYSVLLAQFVEVTVLIPLN